MVKMGALLKTLVFVMVLITSVPVYKGNITLSCFPDKPRLNSPLLCQCKESRGRNIEWYRGKTHIATCSASMGLCFPKPTDYEFNTWMEGPVSYYSLLVKRCKLSDCAEFRCLDFSIPLNEAKRRIEVTQFDSRLPTSFKEPGSSHKSGNINFTTQCVSDPQSVKRNIKFYKIKKNNAMSEFEPIRWNVTEDTVSCATCNGKATTKLTIYFDHDEASGNVDEVQFRVTLFHDSNSSDKLIVTTKYVYFVESDEQVDNCVHALAVDVVLVTVHSWVIMIAVKLCCPKLVHHLGSRLAPFNCMHIVGKMVVFVQAIPLPCICEIVVMIFHYLKDDQRNLERTVWKPLVSCLVDVICVTYRLCVRLLDGNHKTKIFLIWLSIAIYLILNVIVTCIMRLVLGAPNILQKNNAEILTQLSGQSIDQGQSETLLADGQNKARSAASFDIELNESIEDEDITAAQRILQESNAENLANQSDQSIDKVQSGTLLGAPNILQKANAEILTQLSGQSINQGQSETLLADGQNKARSAASFDIELNESIEDEDITAAQRILQESNAENLANQSDQSIDKVQSGTLLAGCQDEGRSGAFIQIELPKHGLKESIDEKDNDQEILDAFRREILRTDSEPVIDLSKTSIRYQEPKLPEPYVAINMEKTDHGSTILQKLVKKMNSSEDNVDH